MDVELVALGIEHRDRVVVEILLDDRWAAGRTEGLQPRHLRVDQLAPGLERRVSATAARAHVDVEAVLDRLLLRDDLEPDPRASGGHGTSLESRRELIEAEAARLVALGATRLRTASEEDLDHYAVSMADPEGNEFDVH